MAPNIPRSRNDFHVALICALPLEADAVHAVFDKFWKDEGRDYGQAIGDENTYTTGVIGEHNVVLAYMPGIGKVNASSVAASLRSSFTNIKVALIIGICGGVPSETNAGYEIYLGDVVFSDTLVQYDLGRLYSGRMVRKDTVEESLGRPSQKIRGLVAMLKTKKYREQLQDEAVSNLQKIQQKIPDAQYPGVDMDRLYEASYLHKHHKSQSHNSCKKCDEGCSEICAEALRLNCEELGCDTERTVIRRRCPSSELNTLSYKPGLHVGAIASGDSVIKSAEHRDSIARPDNIIAFEMEGAGVWDQFPSIVIKGVCDYADSHKNKRWQRFAAATAAAMMKSFLSECTSFATPSEEEETKPSGLWHVPLSRSQGFVGRRIEMEALEDKLFHAESLSKVAVHGLGGVGKSRIAIEVAYRTRHQYPATSVFWVQATNLLTLDKSYLDIGKLMKVPGIENPGMDIKMLVKQYLSREAAGKWLLIIDNADDEAMSRPKTSGEARVTIAQCFPQSSTGSILITTRSRRVAVQLATKNIITLSELNQQEAIDMLRESLVDPSSLGDTNLNAKLVEKLTYLPLALVQAASYMNMNDVSAAHYLNLLDSTEDDTIAILSEDFADEGRYPEAQNPVASTWLISFEYLQTHHPQAADCLAYMSCLVEKDIPHSMLPHATSMKEIVDIIGVLSGYSFLKKQGPSKDGETLYQMHRLVRLVTRNWLRNQSQLEYWVQSATHILAERVPDPMLTTRSQFSLYMPHIQKLCDSRLNNDHPAKYYLLHQLGEFLWYNGRHHEAIRAHLLNVRWLETNKGCFDRTTLKAQNSLAWALGNGSRLSEAVDVAEKANKVLNQHFGIEDTETQNNMRILGSLYVELGRFRDAERISLQATEIAERSRGPEHPTTLNAKTNLAVIYLRLGELDTAEKLGVTVLEAKRKVLPANDPHIKWSLHDLATTYSRLHLDDKAEQMLTELLQSCIQSWGKDHLQTISAMADLATTYTHQSRFTEAEHLGREAFEIALSVIGPSHRITLLSMMNLAIILKQQGRREEGKVLLQQCIQLAIDNLGNDHPVMQKLMQSASYIGLKV